jgi:hypothetical protein
MTAADQAREEEHFREVEGAMLYLEDAARRIGETAKELKGDGAEAYLVEALEAAAEAAREDHAQLMKSVYWRAPSSEQQELTPEGEG